MNGLLTVPVMPELPRRRNGVVVVAVALAYVAAALLGQHFPLSRPTVAGMWPATGVAFAAVVLWGRWAIAGTAAGALVATIAAGGLLPLAPGVAVVAAAQAALAASLLR